MIGYSGDNSWVNTPKRKESTHHLISPLSSRQVKNLNKFIDIRHI